jgi:hypothetical protein
MIDLPVFHVEATHTSFLDISFHLKSSHHVFCFVSNWSPPNMASSNRDFVGVYDLLYHPTTWASRVHFPRGTPVVLLACSAFAIACTGTVGFVTLVAFAKLIDWVHRIVERSVSETAPDGDGESVEFVSRHKCTSSRDIESTYTYHEIYVTPDQSDRSSYLPEKRSLDRPHTADRESNAVLIGATSSSAITVSIRV